MLLDSFGDSERINGKALESASFEMVGSKYVNSSWFQNDWLKECQQNYRGTVEKESRQITDYNNLQKMLEKLHKLGKSCNLKRNINRMYNEKLHYNCLQQLPTLRLKT